MNAPAQSGGERRFGSTAMRMTGGLLIWLANFVFVYSFGAVACARGFARMEVVGLGIVPLVTTLATTLAGLATGLLLRSALRKPAESEVDKFVRFTACATNVIALVAFLFVVLPPLFVDGCDRS